MWRDDSVLLDMLIHARRARKFAAESSWDSFQSDDLIQDAVLRALEVLGEAARRVSEETRSAHPEIPWISIIGMRNAILHEYFRVDLRRVWGTVQDDLPGLIAVLEELVPPEPPSGS
jgi:uncharacterized protein with HEPN domain